MRYKKLTILSGVIATLALAGTPAVALDVLGRNIGINIGGKDSSPNVRANVGDNNVTANIGTNGTGTKATAKAGLGNTATATANANLGTGALSTSTLRQTLSSNVNIDLGKSKKGVLATVDLNGDGVIDSKDTALLALDVNDDGILSNLDDLNGDGLLSNADVNIDLGGDGTSADVDLEDEGPDADVKLGAGDVDLGNLDLSGVDVSDLNLIGDLPVDLGSLNLGPIGLSLPSPTPPEPGITPLPGSFDGPIPGFDPRDQASLSDSFRNLNDNDVAALKIKCVDVMANPNAFKASMVAVCRALASL